MQGFPVAIVSLLWMVFSIIILIFPASPAPDAPDMNYTVAVLGAWLALCLIYYYLPVYGGVHWFRGPIANVDAGDSDSNGEESEQVTKSGLDAIVSVDSVEPGWCGVTESNLMHSRCVGWGGGAYIEFVR